MPRITTDAPLLRLCLALALSGGIFGCEEEGGADEEAPTDNPAEGPAAPATGDPHAGLDLGGAAPQRASGSPVGGVGWEVPEPFRAQTPSSTMRAAEYLFPEEAGETAGTMTVFYFGQGQGGSVQANIDRWVGQFTLPEGTEPSIERREVNGLPVTVIDVTGTFNGGMGSGEGAPSSNQRMLGAIVEGPAGPIFFKMVAAEPLVARAVTPFEELVESFHPES